MDNSLTFKDPVRLTLATEAGRPLAVATAPRVVAFRTSGESHGPITRLVSPSEVGELIKPFVFLDHGEVDPARQPFVGIHPHSGIATLTVVLTGAIHYEDTTGKSGTVPAGGLEWMKAGKGVWHGGSVADGDPMRFFQLWVALGREEEGTQPESQYVPPAAVQSEGPVRVVLGRYGRAASVIQLNGDINYFHVRLDDGEVWRYEPPAGHAVAWLSVDRGALHASERISAGELAVFAESEGAIELKAEGETSFVIGSAIKHPHQLVHGYYSVHTSATALADGEREIRRIGRRLRAEGRL